MKLENIELVEVNYVDNDNKVVMTFFDEENRQVVEVSFNKQIWDSDSKKFVTDNDKAEKVEEWANDYFGVGFAEIGDCIGVRKDVYLYDTFASLWEVQQTNKFTEDMVGGVYQTVVDDVSSDDKFIRIKYTIENKQYESKVSFCKYVESIKEYVIDPIKKKQASEKFYKKYGITVDNAKDLMGRDIFVEVKKAFSSFYGDIKPFPVKK